MVGKITKSLNGALLIFFSLALSEAAKGENIVISVFNSGKTAFYEVESETCSVSEMKKLPPVEGKAVLSYLSGNRVFSLIAGRNGERKVLSSTPYGWKEVLASSLQPLSFYPSRVLNGLVAVHEGLNGMALYSFNGKFRNNIFYFKHGATRIRAGSDFGDLSFTYLLPEGGEVWRFDPASGEAGRISEEGCPVYLSTLSSSLCRYSKAVIGFNTGELEIIEEDKESVYFVLEKEKSVLQIYSPGSKKIRSCGIGGIPGTISSVALRL